MNGFQRGILISVFVVLAACSNDKQAGNLPHPEAESLPVTTAPRVEEPDTETPPTPPGHNLTIPPGSLNFPGPDPVAPPKKDE